MADRGRPHRQRRRGRPGRFRRRRRWFAYCPPSHSPLTTTALSHPSPPSPDPSSSSSSSSKPPVSSHGSSSDRRMSSMTARRGRGVCGGERGGYGGGLLVANFITFRGLGPGVVGPGGVVVGRSSERMPSRRVRAGGCVARAHWRRRATIPFGFWIWRNASLSATS
ncbi:hypothetical protein COCNU_scaffold005527G000010 [Cocos nucifera]|nr:hypothetical protein [Cocos nucifera]